MSTPPSNPPTALLSTVRAARQNGFDRVVFQFDNARPGYQVGYVERPVVEDGSGKAVAVRGARVLRVRMEHALDADLTKTGAPRTYSGPDRLAPGLPEIVEIVCTGALEGVLTWVIGVNHEVAFKVTTLSAPPRLIVDVTHQP